MKRTILCIALLVSPGHAAATANHRQSFVKSWEGRTVVVRQTLYSLVYNERGRLGSTRSGKRDGLVVVTPSQGVYFQFDGRQGRNDVVERNVQRIVNAVNDAYEADNQDVRSYRKVEPLAINRYDPGVQLVVQHVRIDRDQIVLAFSAAGGDTGDEPVTSVRIKWPLPLSQAFSEQDLVENLIRQFVTVATT